MSFWSRIKAFFSPAPAPQAPQAPLTAPTAPPQAPMMTPTTQATQAPKTVINLSWERENPSRAAWTATLFTLVSAQLPIFRTANDLETIRPGFGSLNTYQQIMVLCEMFCQICLYESSWDPACNGGADAGSQDDKNTWSIGLMQLSVCDQESYQLPLGYTFDDLMTVKPNLELGVKIMASQVLHHGKFIMTHGEACYWSSFSYGYPEGDCHVTEILAGIAQLKI